MAGLKCRVMAAGHRPIAAMRRNQRLSATKTALTSTGQCGRDRSEVILDQTILGLLINAGTACMPWGIEE
jgi:hypothetical protein